MKTSNQTSLEQAPLASKNNNNDYQQQANSVASVAGNQQHLAEQLIDSELEWRQLICQLNGVRTMDELALSAPELCQHWQLKRQEVIHELIVTERHHCLTLALMRQVYVQSLRKLNEARLKIIPPTPNSNTTQNKTQSNGLLTLDSNNHHHLNQQQHSNSQAAFQHQGDLVDLERLFPALDDLIQAHELFFAHLRLLLLDSCARKPLGFVGTLGRLLANQFRLATPSSPKKAIGNESKSAPKEQPGTAATVEASCVTSYGHKLLAAYTKFCGQQSNSNRYYKQLMQSDRGFRSLIQSIESNQQSSGGGANNSTGFGCGRRRGIPECNLLVAQRLTKYPLLIEQLIKTSKDEEPAEVVALQEALRECKHLLGELNSQLARKESFERLLDIYANFSLKSYTIYNHGAIATCCDDQSTTLDAQLKTSSKFTKHNLLQHKRLRQLLHLDDQLRMWSCTRRKLVQIVCLVLNDLVVFLRTEQCASTGNGTAGNMLVAADLATGSQLDCEQSIISSAATTTTTTSSSAANVAAWSSSLDNQQQHQSHQHQQVYGSLTPVAIPSQSNGLVYYFANIDNKSSVISLSKLLVREKAQSSSSLDSGAAEPRLYLISSSARQPEMYELAFASKRHQTTFVAKLKGAIEQRRRDLAERRCAMVSRMQRQRRRQTSACLSLGKPSGATCRGGSRSTTDCSIGWSNGSPTSCSCSDDNEEDYYGHEYAESYGRGHEEDEHDEDDDDFYRQDSSSISDDADEDGEDEDRVERLINDDNEAIYTGDNEDEEEDEDAEEKMKREQEAAVSDGFEYDELEPVGDHLRNLDIAEAQTRLPVNNQNKPSAARRQDRDSGADFKFDIEHNILTEDPVATSVSDQLASVESHATTLASNESGLSERARDSMDESAGSGRPRVRANQRRRRLQRLRNVSNQSSSSSEQSSQHRQAISQLLGGNIGSQSNREAIGGCGMVVAIASEATKAAIGQEENEDSGRGLDLEDSSASSTAGSSTSNTLNLNCVKSNESNNGKTTTIATPQQQSDELIKLQAFNLCCDQKHVADPTSQTCQMTSSCGRGSSKSKLASAKSLQRQQGSNLATNKLSKSHCSLLITRKSACSSLSGGLIGSFKTSKDKQSQQQVTSNASCGDVLLSQKERKLSTVSSLSSQVKLFNRLRSSSSNYSVSSQQQPNKLTHQDSSSSCANCKCRCATSASNANCGHECGSHSIMRHPNRRTALFVPEQKLEELRDLQIQLNKDKQEWQVKYERMQEDLLNERRKLDLAYERLKQDQQQVANEREQFYRKLDLLKENGILLTPSHKVHIMTTNNNNNNNMQNHHMLQKQQLFNTNTNYSPTTTQNNLVHLSDTTTARQQTIWHHQQQQQQQLPTNNQNNNPPPYYQHNVHNQSTSININNGMQQQQLHYNNNNNQQQQAMWRPKQQSLVVQSAFNNHQQPRVPIHLANEPLATNKVNIITQHQNINNSNPMSPRNAQQQLLSNNPITMTRAIPTTKTKETMSPQTQASTQHLGAKMSHCLGLTTRIPLLSALGASFLGERQPNSS